MKRALILSLLLATAALPAHAATDAASQALVDRYIAWRGGAAFEAVSSVQQSGSVEAAQLKGKAEFGFDRTGREWETSDLGGFTGSEAVTADQAWQMEQGVLEPMSDSRAREARRDVLLQLGEALRGRGGAVVERRPDEQRDGRTWAVVRVGFGDPDTYDVFIDAKTGELLGWRVTVDRKSHFERYGDWRMVQGVRMPFLTESLYDNAGENVVVRLERVELNKPLAEARFEPPQSARLATFEGGASETAPIPFDFYNGNRLYIPAEVNGHPVKVLLDSGADATVLDTAFAKELGVKPEGKAVGGGTGGDTDFSLARDVKVKIGTMTLKAPVAAIMDLSDVSKRLGLPMPSILGADVFKQLIVDIDFGRRTIAFHEPDSFKVPAGAISVPLLPQPAGRSVPASIEGGPEVQVDFDLGNGSPLFIFPAYWQPHGMLSDRKLSSRLGGAVGGSREEKLGMVKSLTFGGHTFHDIPTEFSLPGVQSVDNNHVVANLGMPVYSRFRLMTDYPHNRLYLIPNAEGLDAPFRKDRAGLNTVFEGDHLRVAFVAPGSPAEAGGWKVGDKVVAVEGQAVAPGYNGSELSRWVYGPAGKAVTLKTADGQVRKLVLKDYF